MKLRVVTPTDVVTELDDIRHIRAEDETGAFGILAGHADFITILPISVVTWRGTNDSEGYVVVRGGVLTITGGTLVEIAARGAVSGDELTRLGQTALDELRRADEEEIGTRTAEARLHLATIRQLERVLQAGRQAANAPPTLDVRGAGESGET